MAVVVIDPGHGGTSNSDGSSWNNATSSSGVLEKDLTLDLARRIRWSLTQGTASAYASEKGKNVDVVLTRDADVNLSLSDRAAVAQRHNASLYLSIHYNGFNGTARGTECFIDRKYMQPMFEISAGRRRALEGPGERRSGLRNINVDADAAFAKRIVDATFQVLQKHDSGARLRTAKYTAARHGESYSPPDGVKMMGLGTLRDAKLGTEQSNCASALLEVEFIDHPAVDTLLNGASAQPVRNELAAQIGQAIVDSL